MIKDYRRAVSPMASENFPATLNRHCHTLIVIRPLVEMLLLLTCSLLITNDSGLLIYLDLFGA